MPSGRAVRRVAAAGRPRLWRSGLVVTQADTRTLTYRYLTIDGRADDLATRLVGGDTEVPGLLHVYDAQGLPATKASPNS